MVFRALESLQYLPREKKNKAQKFYRKLKVNHINITSLLFAVTYLIKGNNLFWNNGWQCAMMES